VVIAVHNQTKGHAAAARLEAAARAGGRAGRVNALPLDLASFASVRAFAEQFLAAHGSSLHLLVNNAGTAQPKSALTPDGFEWVFQVDYLGPFLLTELLLPALRQSQPSSILNVVSGTYNIGCEAAGWPKDCYKDLSYVPPPLIEEEWVRPTLPEEFGSIPIMMPSSTYPHAKFLQNQYTPELARREVGNGVSAFAFSPGLVGTEILFSEYGSVDSPAMKFVCSFQTVPNETGIDWSGLPPNPCPFTPEQAAAGIALTAAGTAVQSGSYFARQLGCANKALNMQGFTEARQAELYERSLQLLEAELQPVEAESVAASQPQA